MTFSFAMNYCLKLDRKKTESIFFLFERSWVESVEPQRKGHFIRKGKLFEKQLCKKATVQITTVYKAKVKKRNVQQGSAEKGTVSFKNN